MVEVAYVSGVELAVAGTAFNIMIGRNCSMSDIVRFKGGLGNQMFQYAFMKSLEKRGRNVTASLGYYREHPDEMQYELDKVFPNLQVKSEMNAGFFRSYEKWKLIKKDPAKVEKMRTNVASRFFWNESLAEHGIFQNAVYDTKECTFTGYWQSYKYFEDIREDIVQDFAFEDGEEKLITMINKIRCSNDFVSVHVRRGDYLNASDMYGNICTKEYYSKAIAYMKRVIKNPVFIFFSDDINWVKQEMQMAFALYVDKDMFDCYKPWYDMSLMSACSGNITANSSFSWWGAWLNQRQGHITVAPQKWLNGAQCTDICPDNWVRM